MRWIERSTKNSYFRDEINPGPCEVLNREEVKELQMRIDQRRLVEPQVRERSQNTKS